MPRRNVELRQAMDRLTRLLGYPWSGNELTIGQAEALIEHLQWLDGLMPSERMHAEEQARLRLQVRQWYGEVPHYRHRDKKGGDTDSKRAATLANLKVRSRFSRTRPAAYRSG